MDLAEKDEKDKAEGLGDTVVNNDSSVSKDSSPNENQNSSNQPNEQENANSTNIADMSDPLNLPSIEEDF